MVVFSSREDGEKRFKATIPSYFRWTPFCNQIFLSIIDEQIQLSRVVRFLRSRNVKRIWKARLENYINKNKREERRKKIKASPIFSLCFPPPSLLLSRISFTETINWFRGYKQRATIYTHAAAPPNTEIQTERIYICSSICRCVTEHRLTVLEIYIYISRAKLPPLSNHSIDAPHPSSLDYVCKRLPFLSIQFYPENLLKRAHCTGARRCWVTVTGRWLWRGFPVDSPLPPWPQPLYFGYNWNGTGRRRNFPF